MTNLELYNKLKSVPEEAKKKITGGRLSGMTDINPMWRLKKLTEEFGICGVGWKYEITDKRLEKGCNEEISAFIQINLFIKVSSEWSDAIVGIGGASFVSKEKNGMYQSDECFKMALTDAISVACKALGMGADVYFEKDRSKYEPALQQTPPAQQQKPIVLSPELEKQLTQAIATLESIDSLEKVKTIWESLPELHSNSLFKYEITKAKNKFNGTK